MGFRKVRKIHILSRNDSVLWKLLLLSATKYLQKTVQSQNLGSLTLYNTAIKFEEAETTNVKVKGVEYIIEYQFAHVVMVPAA